MRIFKTKDFARFARREAIADERLREAIERAERGLIDANLGGGLIKQRVARAGRGRSGGFRTIIVWRARGLAIFVYGFAKSRRDNLSESDLADLRGLSGLLLGYGSGEIEQALAAGELLEVKHDEQTG